MEETNQRQKNTASETGCEPCPLCGGTGFIMRQMENGERVSRFCKCEIVRRNWIRLKNSGLEDLARRYTFQSYQTPEEWQRTAKKAAMNYAANWNGKWFFVGGDSGTGKTHLCTAACVQLIESGIPVRYMQWRGDIPSIKAVVNDEEKYQAAIGPLKSVKALYIDDFLKGAATEADRNIAFELLNHRYIDREKVTILSSEMTLDRIIAWDEAVGGRISERAKGFVFNLRGKKNWRLQE